MSSLEFVELARHRRRPGLQIQVLQFRIHTQPPCCLRQKCGREYTEARHPQSQLRRYHYCSCQALKRCREPLHPCSTDTHPQERVPSSHRSEAAVANCQSPEGPVELITKRHAPGSRVREVELRLLQITGLGSGQIDIHDDDWCLVTSAAWEHGPRLSAQLSTRTRRRGHQCTMVGRQRYTAATILGTSQVINNLEALLNHASHLIIVESMCVQSLATSSQTCLFALLIPVCVQAMVLIQAKVNFAAPTHPYIPSSLKTERKVQNI